MRPDIEYGRAGGQSLLMDAYFPEGQGPFPAIVLVHGGAWVGGDRRLNVQPLFKPLTDSGYAVFSISYRFASDIFSFGYAIDDVRQAIRHVRAHATTYGIDPGRIGLLGESAGGHLSLMAALKSDDPQEAVTAVVALYPPTDLVTMARSSTLIPQSIRDSIHGTPWAELILAGLRRFSPIEYVRQNMPPFLLMHGTADTLVPFDQSVQMCDKIRGAGGSCELVPVKDAPHGIRRWEGLSAAASYKRTILDWLAKQFGPIMVPAVVGQ
jgi:alpha-L-fucosidase 2